MITARCPGSAGELIQGYFLGGVKLISYPIDCYSSVTLVERKRDSNENLKSIKSYKMLESVFEYYGYTAEDSYQFSLDIDSNIPPGKGMASSTADLAATAKAAAKYLNNNISNKEIAKLCVMIEPTDSIVFSEITLFDYLEADYSSCYGDFPECKVLVLEGKGVIDTLDFHKNWLIEESESNKNRWKTNIEKQESLKEALAYFELGMRDKDLKKLGKAAVISALANQDIIYKPGLEDICDLSIYYGAYGLNVAHSGTVVSILYNNKHFDREGFLYHLKGKEYMEEYISIMEYNIVTGGAVII